MTDSLIFESQVEAGIQGEPRPLAGSLLLWDGLVEGKKGKENRSIEEGENSQSTVA